ncbi:MAG: peptidyl-prolyl cis-trans isomerase [Thermoleophilaceae bacterium]
MTHRKLSLLAVGASLAATALVVTGCGNDVPPNAVAKVGDTVIKKSEFDRWLNAAARGSQPPGSEVQVSVPDPPNFTKCAATKKEQPVPEGAQQPTDQQLKDQCKAEYDSLKEQVMQFLVSAEWILQEAGDRGIEVTDAEVMQQFEDQKEQSFPDDEAYKEFLEVSGQTEQDLLFRVRLDVISNKVRQEVLEGKSEVSNDDVRAYYEENKERFAQPERRDLAVVLTRNKSQADSAHERLEDGESFREVAADVSIDEATKSQGGKLPGVAQGQQEEAFDQAIFSAERGELTGPVETQFGWYVFEVTKVTEAEQQTVQEAAETIRNLLRAEREQKALDDFIEDFREKYKDDTACADGFVIQDCENAPEPEDTGPASGGSPQGAPQQVPQQGVPPQGVPPQGVPPQGVPPQGAPPQGVPPQGGAPQGGQPVPIPQEP